MANFRGSPKELDKALLAIKKRNIELLKLLRSKQGRVLLQGGLIVAGQAKINITEKGHVVTGTLRRSQNAQLKTDGPQLSQVDVGTFIEYAPFVEALPDGGFLNVALEKKAGDVTKLFITQALDPALRRWGR